MIKYHIVCDYREKFINSQNVYNDHHKYENIKNIVNVINELGYTCDYFGGVNELISAYEKGENFKNDIFLNFNDGLTQLHKRGQSPMLLEMLSCKYSGSDPFTSLLISDKYCTNRYLSATTDICTPKNFICFDKIIPCEESLSLNYPVLLKPNNEGSSIGITQDNICRSYNNMVQRLKQLFNDYDKIIVEEYIEGYELTVFIVGNKEKIINQPLLIGRDNKYYFENEIFDAESKFQHLRTYNNPSNYLSTETIEAIKQTATLAFDALCMRDYGRIDIRLKGNMPYLLEANTVPAIGLSSDVGAICKILNISFADFISKIIDAINKRLLVMS